MSFDDTGTGWFSGPSGFSFGSTSYPEATQIAWQSADFIATLYRRRFWLDDPANVEQLILRIDYEDGFVAYLNGRETARRHLPGSPGEPVPFDTPAEIRLRGASEEIDLTAFRGDLKRGWNLLAIQGHSARIFDSFFSMTPELLANMTRGPMVQNLSSNRVDITWKTPKPRIGVVDYGTTPFLGSTAMAADAAGVTPRTEHAVRLSNLVPGTRYYYRARLSADGGGAPGGADGTASPVDWFDTLTSRMGDASSPDPAGDVRFVFLGDSGSGSRRQYEIAEVIRLVNPDFVLHGGDLVYPSFIAERADSKCFSVYREIMRHTPFFTTVGNHDFYAGVEHYMEAFSLPTNPVTAAVHEIEETSPEHYYSFDGGPVHFVSLFQPILSQYHLREWDAQYQWLREDLAATDQPWKILFFHGTYNSSGHHRSDDYNGNSIPDRFELQEILAPVLEEFGVQMVLNGHDHLFERLAPVNGTSVMVSGGGGIFLYPLREYDPGSARFVSTHHCVEFLVSDTRLEARTLDFRNEVIDTMTLQLSAPDARTRVVPWGAPIVETGLPDDGDGNIVGQEFDFHFRSEPVPALTGRHSTAGRLVAEFDQEYLYLGLDQIALRADQHLLVFVGSEARPGVASLEAVGNGVEDPDGQGMDGLDRLDRLHFSGFAPSIGVVAGDELGDGYVSGFRRDQASWAAGQGIVFLDGNLAPVPGARIQQYHESPQVTPTIGESGSNYIELAIPLSQLGSIGPGARVQIGAVVMLDPVTEDGGLGEPRLDSGFLGESLDPGADGGWTLRGLSFVLDPDPDRDADLLPDSRELQAGSNPVNPDSDDDGFLDGWEVSHRSDPLSAEVPGPGADRDGDGTDDRLEALIGTDPLDAESNLALRIESVGAGILRLRWSDQIAKPHRLESAAGLNGPWVVRARFEGRAGFGWERAVARGELGSTTVRVGGRLEYFRLIVP